MIIVSESAVQVKIDDRARLLMAVLAAGHWPDMEQVQAPHAVHPHTKQVRRHVQGLAHHPAVIGLNQALAESIPMSDLFSAAIRCRWPDFEQLDTLPALLAGAGWVNDLADFRRVSTMESFWSKHESSWEESRSELEAVFQGRRLISFLERVTERSEKRPVLLMPSIVYPMLRPILADSSSELLMILPPAKAWGESPPWPFGEDPAWVIAQTCRYLIPHFTRDMLSQLDETRQALLQHAVVTVCLEREFDEAEAMAYMVRIRKEEALPQLSMAVESVREFLVEPANGSLIDVI